MSQNKRSDNKNIGAGKGEFEIKNPRNKSNQELLDEIDMILSTSSYVEIDTDKIEQYLAILQERAPVMEDYSTVAEWNRLIDDHPLLFEEEATSVSSSNETPMLQSMRPERSRKSILLIRWAEIFVAVMFCLVITANAFNFNPIQAFLKWAEGVIQVYSNPSGIMELPESDPSEYHSLEEALVANGIDNNNCPNWVPQDYTLSKVEMRSTDEVIRYSAIYEAARGELLIRVTEYLSDIDWSTAEEREEGGYSYTQNDIEYYIIANYHLSKAMWREEQYVYIISGQVTEDELKEMIKSIS